MIGGAFLPEERERLLDEPGKALRALYLRKPGASAANARGTMASYQRRLT